MKTEVSIQSISKVFTMAQVIQEQGLDAIEKRHRRRCHGRGIQLHHRHRGSPVVGTGAPEMNALVNPGAISSTSMVQRFDTPMQVWAKIIGFHNDCAGRPLTVLQDVYKSEADTNQRNQAIGALMFAYGYIKTDWSRRSISTRGSAPSASTPGTWR